MSLVLCSPKRVGFVAQTNLCPRQRSGPASGPRYSRSVLRRIRHGALFSAFLSPCSNLSPELCASPNVSPLSSFSLPSRSLPFRSLLLIFHTDAPSISLYPPICTHHPRAICASHSGGEGRAFIARARCHHRSGAARARREPHLEDRGPAPCKVWSNMVWRWEGIKSHNVTAAPQIVTYTQ